MGQRAPYVVFKEPVTGRLLSVSSQPRVLLRWTVQKYPMQVAPSSPHASSVTTQKPLLRVLFKVACIASGLFHLHCKLLCKVPSDGY